MQQNSVLFFFVCLIFQKPLFTYSSGQQVKLEDPNFDFIESEDGIAIYFEGIIKVSQCECFLYEYFGKTSVGGRQKFNPCEF